VSSAATHLCGDKTERQKSRCICHCVELFKCTVIVKEKIEREKDRDEERA
jgi:hypothetical protein